MWVICALCCDAIEFIRGISDVLRHKRGPGLGALCKFYYVAVALEALLAIS